MAAFVGIQAWSAWKNNSLSQDAKVADLQLTLAKKGITEIAVETVDLASEVEEPSWQRGEIMAELYID